MKNVLLLLFVLVNLALSAQIEIKGIIVETEAYSQEEEACHGHHKMTTSNLSLIHI